MRTNIQSSLNKFKWYWQWEVENTNKQVNYDSFMKYVVQTMQLYSVKLYNWLVQNVCGHDSSLSLLPPSWPFVAQYLASRLPGKAAAKLPIFWRSSSPNQKYDPLSCMTFGYIRANLRINSWLVWSGGKTNSLELCRKLRDSKNGSESLNNSNLVS